MRITWALGSVKLGERFASWAAEANRRSGWGKRIATERPVIISILASAALAAFATWNLGRVGIEIVVIAGFSLAITGSMALLRSGSYTWVPSVAAGMVLAPFSITFAPVPCADRQSVGPYWAPILLLSAASIVLVAATLINPVPITRLAAIAAVAMLASALLPVPPHDGAFLPKRRWDYAATGLLTAVAAGLVLNWI